MSNSSVSNSVQPYESLASIVNFLKKFQTISRHASTVGMYFFLIMVAITTLDVILRYLFNKPLDGTIEVTEFIMAIVFFSSAGHTQWTGGQISMDIITGKLTPSTRSQCTLITNIWSLVTVTTCTWAMYRYAANSEIISAVYAIPLKPFIYFAATGCILVIIALLHDVLNGMLNVLREKGAGTCAFAVTVSIACILAAAWFATHKIPGMTPVQLGVIGMVFMFLLFFSGMHVAYSLMATALIFIANMKGINAADIMMQKFWYSTVASYDMSPLMFFLLMGYVCFEGNFGQDLYRAGRNWLGHYRAGLASGSICACTAFGAVVGDGLAGSVAMSAIALPEMRKNNYSDTLSVGCLACSGTIGSLIPPSTCFILYAVLAEQSVSELFIAGVIPGLVCMVCFILTVWVWACIDPKAAPPAPKTSREEAWKSLSSAGPILAIFILVIGGIYGGIFTATEGGGMGVFGMLGLAIIMKRMTGEKLSKALNQSSKFTCMCFTLMAGANFLGYFMTVSRIPMVLANSIAALSVPPMLVMAIIIIVLCILGCFIPAIPLVLICVPIFVPIAKVYGWDLIWFGVITTLVKNMACITPPFGINLFVLKGLADVPI